MNTTKLLKDQIYVGFSKSNALTSKIIRFIDNSPVSHTFLVYWDLKMQDWMVCQADFPKGIALDSLSHFEIQNVLVGLFQVPGVDLRIGLPKIGPAAMSEFYDVEGLLGMAYVTIASYLKKKTHNPLASHNAMFCSEFVDRVILASLKNNTQLTPLGIDGTVLLDPPSVSPKEIYDALMHTENWVNL